MAGGKLEQQNLQGNNLSWDDLKKILDNSFDEIFVVDGKGMVVYVNEACERHYGLKPSDVIGKTVHYLVNEGYYSPALAPVVFREKKTVTLEQVTNFGKKLVVTAVPILNNQGEIEFVVMNSRDITHIEQLKHDLDETRKLVEKYKQEVHELRQKEISFDGYIAHSKKMRACLQIAQRVAAVDSTVLILGESGTGKNVLAKFIHNHSTRKDGPFMSINCAAIPEQLLESELFGYCRGAFTGAEKSGKVGLVELADGGTLFLDEIGEVPLKLQAKLLELVQDNSFLPVGGKEHKKVNIRILAATNRNLLKLVEEKSFREDLYYRLNVIEIALPPLRERTEDIIPLLCYFLDRYNAKYKVSHQFSQKCLDMLVRYSWPGNVREVEHLVERLVVTVPETKILPEHLPENIRAMQDSQPGGQSLPPITFTDGVSIKEKEKELIIQLYRQLGSSYKVAAALNISQSKATRVIRKHLNRASK